jgi:hypothetical protein
MDTASIKIWNNLSSSERIAFGDHYITHESNLHSWDKNFDKLSPLKKKRVLSHVQEFSKIPDHQVRG